METIDWVSGTERFTYVCSATSALEVNLGPLRALGWRRIDHIILLVGAGSIPTALDLRNALEPAERFGKIVEGDCKKQKINPPRIERVCCPPDSTDAWYDWLLVELYKTDSPLVLLNLTGGTRSMIFAALAALQKNAKDNRKEPNRTSRAFIYSSGPERVEEVWPELGRQTLRLPQEPRPSVRNLLHSRGLVAMTTEQEDQDRREAAQRRGDFTRTLFELIASKGDKAADDRAAAMHGIIRGRIKDIEDIGPEEEVWIERDQLGTQAELWHGIEQAADGLGGLLTFPPGGMVLHGQAAVRYFQGGWFEEWAFLQCLDALRNRPWWDVQWSFPFGYHENGRTDGECDVLVTGEGTTFLLECKAGVRLVPDEKPINGKPIRRGKSIRRVRELPRKIAGWRDSIAGGRGAAAIMLLVPPRDDSQRRMLEHEAAQKKVSVWIGKSGRDIFKRWIGELAWIR